MKSQSLKPRSELLSGMRLGLVLQLSIGPVSLSVFNNAGSYGFSVGLLTALGVLTIDALYAFLAGCGISSFMNTPRAKVITRVVGCAVLLLLGVNSILHAFSMSLFPRIGFLAEMGAGSAYLQGALLAASAPMGILFFAGLFASEAAERSLSRWELFQFGAGIILTRVLFLSGLALLGSLVVSFLSEFYIRILNGAVGLFLIYVGIKVGLGKRKAHKIPNARPE